MSVHLPAGFPVAIPPAFTLGIPVLTPSSLPRPPPILCSDVANVFVQQTNVTIGSKYRKAVYRQYTDATFTKKVRKCCIHCTHLQLPRPCAAHERVPGAVVVRTCCLPVRRARVHACPSPAACMLA